MVEISKAVTNQYRISNLEADQRYRLEATSITENKKESFGVSFLVEKTKPSSGGLPTWLIVLLPVVGVVVLVGVCGVVFCCRE